MGAKTPSKAKNSVYKDKSYKRKVIVTAGVKLER